VVIYIMYNECACIHTTHNHMAVAHSPYVLLSADFEYHIPVICTVISILNISNTKAQSLIHVRN